MYAYQKKGGKIGPDIIEPTVLDDERLQLVIHGDEKQAGKLYDVITTEIEVMRVFQIKVSTNTSIYPIETLANIMGSLPIVADAYEYDPIESDMKLTDKNSIIFHLKVDCAFDAVMPRVVTSKDIVVSKDVMVSTDTTNKILYPVVSMDTTNKILYQDIKICTLTRGQSLDVTLYATKTNTKSHNHATAVRNVPYRRLPKVRIKKQPPNPEIMKTICPVNVFDIEDSILIVARNDQCIMCRECLGDYVGLKTDSSRYEMIIQSNGTMSPTDILNRAIKIYNKD